MKKTTVIRCPFYTRKKAPVKIGIKVTTYDLRPLIRKLWIWMHHPSQRWVIKRRVLNRVSMYLMSKLLGYAMPSRAMWKRLRCSKREFENYTSNYIKGSIGLCNNDWSCNYSQSIGRNGNIEHSVVNTPNMKLVTVQATNTRVCT